MLNLLSADGTLNRLWSLDGTFQTLVEDTPLNRLKIDACCCRQIVACNCDSITTMNYRLTLQAVGCDSADIGACATTLTKTGTLTLQVGSPTDTSTRPNECGGTITKYWKETVDLSVGSDECADPAETVIEVICCTIQGGVREIQVSINGQSWRVVSAVDVCLCNFVLASISSTEINVTGTGVCCGTPVLQLWTDECATPDPPNCDAQDTGAG